MTINEYQELALRTESPIDYESDRLVNGVLGLNGEAGECADMLKKALFQHHSFNMEHFAKELGDVAWYLAVTADAIGYDLESILLLNIEKLKKRYPEGHFSAENSVNRKEDDV